MGNPPTSQEFQDLQWRFFPLPHSIHSKSDPRLLPSVRSQSGLAFFTAHHLDPSHTDTYCRPICIEETFPLRHSVLWPGKPISHVSLPEDEKGVHLGAFLASRDQPVAVISLFVESVPSSACSFLSQSGVEPGEPGQVRFRKFACDPEYQGQGIGTKLLQHAIIVARSDMSAKIVWCDARTSSSGWYQKRGLTPFGEIFFKNAVEYVRMYIDVRNSVSL